LNLIVIGDIVGRPGRRAIKNLLPRLKEEFQISFTIANAENASGGRGLSWDVANELIGYGIDVLTMGNHVWDNKELLTFIDDMPQIIRPANYPEPCPGHGYEFFDVGLKKIAVINLSGRVYLNDLDCPFRKINDIIHNIKALAHIIIVDFHAEATSEKLALAHFVDGQVTAVLGTHTHIQTADEQILSKGTAYITDLGMTGPIDSVLGMDKNMVLQKFLTQRPVRLDVAKGKAQIQGVVLEIDELTNSVTRIQRFSRIVE
jgi:metallophosphoesterase (TIGR00282 family)